eukprot:364456-Chlamydomonas_euryale.AAC.2
MQSAGFRFQMQLRNAHGAPCHSVRGEDWISPATFNDCQVEVPHRKRKTYAHSFTLDVTLGLSQQ